MRFVTPSLLIWCSLAAVPIVLYLVRPRPKTQRVTTLAFFKSLQRAYQETAWLRRLKQLLSLLLSVIVILAAGFALARLVVSPPADALKTVFILVDRSASMQVRDGEGPSSLEKGLAAVRERLDGLSGGVTVMVAAYDRRPELLLSRTQDRRAVRRALDQIAVRPLAGDTQRAVSLAAELAALDRPAVVWHVTDHAAADEKPVAPPDVASNSTAAPTTATLEPTSAVEPAPPLPEGVRVEEIVVGHAKPVNAGITALELRHAPASRILHEAYVQVHAAVEASTDAELEVSINGKLIDLRKLKLEPDRPERLLLSLEADPEREGLLAVRVKLPGDVLAVDDSAFARVPRARPLKVIWITASRDPYTELALTSLGGGYEISVGGPDAWPPAEMPGAAIFDGWTPKEWPTDVPAVVMNPPASFGPVRVVRLKDDGVYVERVRAAQNRHPLLLGVANDRVSVVQTALFDAPGLLEPLWLSPSSEAMLAAGHAQNQPLVVFGFEPARSENLPLMASYPLLLGNAVTWVARAALADEEGRNHRTGDLVELADERDVVWSPPPGAKDATDETIHAAGRWYELDRVGPWQTAAGKLGTASLLAERETKLIVAPQTDAATTSGGFWRLSGDLTNLLLWLVLGVLVAESWLFHRRAVY